MLLAEWARGAHAFLGGTAEMGAKDAGPRVRPVWTCASLLASALTLFPESPANLTAPPPTASKWPPAARPGRLPRLPASCTSTDAVRL